MDHELRIMDNQLSNVNLKDKLTAPANVDMTGYIRPFRAIQNLFWKAANVNDTMDSDKIMIFTSSLGLMPEIYEDEA